MTERTNKFGGRCRDCGKTVFEGKGLCGKTAAGKWYVRHNADCGDGEYNDAPRAPRNNDPKPNQYGGRCVLCGIFVAEKAGRIVKTNAGWKAAHLTPEACVTAAAEKVEQAPEPEFPVPYGYYAIPSNGTNDLDFFCIKAGKGKWEGRTFVNRVIGGRVVFGVRISRDESKAAVDGILAAGVEASRLLYAKEVGNCAICNHLLTDEESRRRGIGPECAKNAGVLAAA